jgi:uncharacterized protein (DUF1501 family)
MTMARSSKSRREFLRNLGCLVCSGSALALIPQLRMLGSALAATTPFTDYKALVCVYIAGGNDSWNMLVPYDTARYNTYMNSRGGVYDPVNNAGGLALARPTAGDAQIVTDAADSSQYFLHPSLVNLASVYKQAKLAFLVNAGTLVTPIDMTDYNASSANRPPQLFSHADQENLWHQANTTASSTLGWGGLCADNLQLQGANGTPIGSGPALSLCVSVSGANRFEVGSQVTPYQMSSSGLNSLHGMCNTPPCGNSTTRRDDALNALLGATYANDFNTEYAATFKRGRDLYAMLNPGLIGTTLATTFPTTSLGNQLQVVAQMIKLSKAQNYASRQIYYVRLGGFDLHSGLFSSSANSTTDHAGLLTQLDGALGAFWAELQAQGIQNEVTTFTASEFARTLQSNGSGSDHGWGGVQLAFGGAVNGGKLYSNGQNGKGISGFPNQAYGSGGNPNAFSRGQLIPGVSVDQYAATMAQWMGITASADLNAIFPNLANFGTHNLGFV